MSIPVAVCTACGTAAFPPPLLCPRCAGSDWRDEEVEQGRVERVTECDGVRIAEVRTPLGPIVIVRLVTSQGCGGDLALEMIDGVPTAFDREEK